MSRSNHAPTNRDVVAFVTELECERKKSRLRSKAARLTNFIQSVQHFSDAFSLFAQSATPVGPLVWGAVQLTFLVCRTHRLCSPIVFGT